MKRLITSVLVLILLLVMVPTQSVVATDYTTDFLKGGVASASTVWSVTHDAAKAFDDGVTTRWSSGGFVFPHWIKYDLGVNTAKVAGELRVMSYVGNGGIQFKDFKLLGSNNDVTWVILLEGQAANSEGWQDWEFENSNAYRYYMIEITTSWATNLMASLYEVELRRYADTTVDYEDTINRLEIQVEALRLQSIVWDVRLNELDSTIVSFGDYVTDLNVESGPLLEAYSTLEDKFEAEMGALRAEVANLETHLTGARSAMANLETETLALERALALNEYIGEVESNLSGKLSTLLLLIVIPLIVVVFAIGYFVFRRQR